MIDFKKLKELRKKTGVSFSTCKKVLEESKNDIKKAEKMLIALGETKIKEKSGKKTKAGQIFSYVHHNGHVASLVELQCETDFVSDNQEFKNLGHDLAMQIASLKPKTIKELLNQDFIKDPTKKISELINESVLKFGEKIIIFRIIVWSLGEK